MAITTQHILHVMYYDLITHQVTYSSCRIHIRVSYLLKVIIPKIREPHRAPWGHPTIWDGPLPRGRLTRIIKQSPEADSDAKSGLLW